MFKKKNSEKGRARSTARQAGLHYKEQDLDLEDGLHMNEARQAGCSPSLLPLPVHHHFVGAGDRSGRDHEVDDEMPPLPAAALSAEFGVRSLWCLLCRQ